MIVAVCVSAGSSPGSSPPSDVSFEIPKSSSFTDGDPSALRVTKRFDGLRSRCTMPAACTSASASHAWSAISHASSIGSAPSWSISLPRSTPLEVLHDDVRDAALFERAHVVHAGHVLALHLRGDLRLAEEPLDGHLVAHGLGQEELDGHLLVEPLVDGRRRRGPSRPRRGPSRRGTCRRRPSRGPDRTGSASRQAPPLRVWSQTALGPGDLSVIPRRSREASRARRDPRGSSCRPWCRRPRRCPSGGAA